MVNEIPELNAPEEVLFGPVFDRNSLGVELLTGLGPAGRLENNICNLTDHTNLIFSPRESIERSGPNKPFKKEIDASTNIENYYVPDDISPLELVALIDDLYESGTYENRVVKNVIAERLHGTSVHLKGILNKAKERLGEEAYGRLYDITALQSNIENFLEALNFDKETVQSESLIKLTHEEVDERIDRLIDRSKKSDGERFLLKYAGYVSAVATSGLYKEINMRLRGETDLALFSRGNRYLAENILIPEAFKKRPELKKAVIELGEQAVLTSPSGSEQFYPTLRESLSASIEHLRVARQERPPEESTKNEELVFFESVMRKIAEYDGWVSDFYTSVSETAPAKVVQYGVMNCINRAAVAYGLLKDAGWADGEIYSVLTGAHVSLIVKNQDEYYMMDPGVDDKEGPVYAIYKVLGEEEFVKIMKDVEENGKANTTYMKMIYQFAYWGRDSEVYKGNKGIALSFMNLTSTVLGNSGRQDLKDELLDQVLALDPTNYFALWQKERDRKIKRSKHLAGADN